MTEELFREHATRLQCEAGGVAQVDDARHCAHRRFHTADVSAVVVTKIEKKSAMTRRVVRGFANPG